MVLEMPQCQWEGGHWAFISLLQGWWALKHGTVTNKNSLTRGEEEGGMGWWASKCSTSQTRTHSLEGRKREEQVGGLQNVACHKQGLTNWKGGRGRSGLVSFETWHVTNENSPTGGEKEGGVSWWALKCGTITNKDSLTGGGEGGVGWWALKHGAS